jgi:hypothetical protein
LDANAVLNIAPLVTNGKHGTLYNLAQQGRIVRHPNTLVRLVTSIAPEQQQINITGHLWRRRFLRRGDGTAYQLYGRGT